MPKENAKNLITDKEFIVLLQFIFELGRISESFKKYQKNFTKGINQIDKKMKVNRISNVFVILQIVDALYESRAYSPNELNRVISEYFKLLAKHHSVRIDELSKNSKSNMGKNKRIDKSKNVGLTSHDIADKEIFSPFQINEMLQFLVELKILKNVQGKKEIKKIEIVRPGRKSNTKDREVMGGYPSRYILTDEYVTLKKLFHNEQLVCHLKKFLLENNDIMNYLKYLYRIIFYIESKYVAERIEKGVLPNMPILEEVLTKLKNNYEELEKIDLEQVAKGYADAFIDKIFQVRNHIDMRNLLILSLHFTKTLVK